MAHHPPMSSPGSELRRVRSLIADLDGIVWEADARTMLFTFVSSGSTPILGYTPQEWLADPTFWADRIHPDDRERTIAQFVRAATAGWSFDTEYRVLARDGSVVWLRDLGHVVRDVEGRPTLLRGLMVDVTKQKLVEEERRSAEERFRTVVERLPAIVYLEAIEDEPGASRPLLYVSPQVESILGLHDPGVARQPRRALRPVRRRRRRPGAAGAQARGGARRAVQRRVPDARARRSNRLVPGRGGPGAGRGGPAGVLAGHHVRRHAPARERGARTRDRDPLPGARRAAAGDRLLRVREGRRARPHVHQLARGGDPGSDPRGVARGSGRELARPHPPGRSRCRRTGEHPLRPDRRAVRRRVPHDHGRRPNRVDPRRGGPGPRRAGQPEVLAGRDVGHHGAARGREQPGGRGGALPGAGRADADDHLPGLAERAAVHAVHEPADHVDPRLHARRTGTTTTTCSTSWCIPTTWSAPNTLPNRWACTTPRTA